MDHLSLDVLSRLVEETPAPEELDHLGRCGRCARELDELRRQTAALGALPDVRPPRGDWDELEARLAAEGLVALDAARPAAAPEQGPADLIAHTPWLRRAASVAIFLGGAATGTMVAERVVPGETEEAVAATRIDAVTDPGEALVHMQDAERAYIGALAHYRRLLGARGGDDAAGDPRTRYAALEQLVQAGQAAVSQAPADPFLNGVLASALAEQQAVYHRLTGGAQDGWF